jgi:hypothetical protein
MNLRIRLVIIAVASVLLLVLPVSASETVTIRGEVNDNNQIVDSNGKIYEIADSEKGYDLVDNHIGEVVKVTGTLEHVEDATFIKVVAFEILAE